MEEKQVLSSQNIKDLQTAVYNIRRAQRYIAKVEKALVFRGGHDGHLTDFCADCGDLMTRIRSLVEDSDFVFGANRGFMNNPQYEPEKPVIRLDK